MVEIFTPFFSLFFITDSNILEDIFRALAGLKFETLLLSFDCFSAGETEKTVALSGKSVLEILLFISSGKDWESTIANSFASVRDVLLVPVDFLSSMYLGSFSMFAVVTLLNRNFPRFWELPKFS